jgi:hypothetical protein
MPRYGDTEYSMNDGDSQGSYPVKLAMNFTTLIYTSIDIRSLDVVKDSKQTYENLKCISHKKGYAVEKKVRISEEMTLRMIFGLSRLLLNLKRMSLWNLLLLVM